MGAGVKVWIPGKLENPLNGSHGHWTQARSLGEVAARKSADVSTHYEDAALGLADPPRRPRSTSPSRPTSGPVLTTTTSEQRSSTYRDALKDMKIIDDDRESSGHEFHYRQVVSRGKNAKRGVEVEVTPR